MNHSPCGMCGMAESPRWRGPTKRQNVGLICGRCASWLTVGPGEASHDARDVAAAVLAGISTETRRTVPRGLGGLVSLTLWHELDTPEANASPWAHVDVVALRARVAELAVSKHFRLPSKWNPHAVVAW